MADNRLSRENLQTADAVFSLGLVVVRELSDQGIVSVFINEAGVVEVAPPGELELDVMPQDDALAVLLDRGYGDGQLIAYLKGRKAREALRG